MKTYGDVFFLFLYHFFQFDNVLQLWNILQQITLTLAVAEEALEFEQRDLRLNRVLVKRAWEEKVNFVIAGRRITVETRGVKAHITGLASARMTDGGCSFIAYISDSL
ncbi:hypothetical protein HPB48_023318 [Haemaphysalis longicornis]|uniref:Uncharacterized protein n=1 Tax=Haemaphysalis longicornis TaxID=44386 RepID=A0A9J6GW99_HAELO|nr:hypothetical protein HPB48_023318 [Haemaphysalis longicornis]